MANTSSTALPKKAFELVKRFERQSGLLEDINSRLSAILDSKDEPTLCNLLLEEYSKKLDDLEVVLRQMDSIDHPIMIDLRSTAANLQSKKLNLLLAVKKHEIEFKSGPTRSSSRSSQGSRPVFPNPYPSLCSEQCRTIHTNVASPIDLSAPFSNPAPHVIATTTQPTHRNVTSISSNLNQLDLLGVEHSLPTPSHFLGSTTEPTFSNFHFNPIQTASPHIPLNPMFSDNVQNTHSVRNDDLVCNYSTTSRPSYMETRNLGQRPTSLGIPSVRFNFRNEAPVHPSPVTATSAGFGTFLPQSNPTGDRTLCERSPFKLPDIKLDRFDGNPLRWPDWFAMFQSAIDNNKRLSESEKLTYLQTLVSGSAKEAISFYSCNPLFYKTAVEELRRRFGHPKHIVKSFISELQKFPAPQLSSPSTFISHSVFLRKLVQTFESFHFDSDLDSSFLLEAAVAKLPAAVHLKWNEYVLLNFPNGARFREFSAWLAVYAQACEDLPETSKQNDRTPVSSKAKTDWLPIKKQDKLGSIACPIDNEKHHLGKCPTFLKKPVSDRISFVKSSNLCFNCVTR